MHKQWFAAFFLSVCLPLGAEPDFKALGQQALKLSRDYIRIGSVNPPADTRQTAAFLEKLFQQEGIPVRLYESSPGHVNLLAHLKGSSNEGRLLLVNHMDVVPADASRWPVDPFSAALKDGFLYGRGAIDMKTTGIFQALTLIALKREKVPLKRDVLFLASADEESGGEHGAQWMIQHHWEDVRADYALDEGGFGTPDLLSADGSLIFGVSVAEKKVLWAQVTAVGTSGHGSQPVADNANDRLREALNRLDAMVKAKGQVQSSLLDEFRRRCPAMADNKFTRAIQRDTLSITSLRSGVGEPPKVNVIPSKAEATLDFRLMPETQLQPFLTQIEKLWSDLEGVSLQVLHATDPTPVSDYNTPLFANIEKAVRQEYPQAVVTPYLVPFGTDSNGFRQKGVKAYGLGTAVLDASIVASMHSDAERIPVDQFEPALRIYYRCVAGYATSP
ncbi:M20/M25/M40 family metallo-hydrolase [bacterium]|nr:M20/M25/M40 family metallo-hydrolase [bacterium]